MKLLREFMHPLFFLVFLFLMPNREPLSVGRQSDCRICIPDASISRIHAYLTVKEVPESLTQSVPYVATLVVLATATKRLRPPMMAGIPYRPGEGH